MDTSKFALIGSSMSGGAIIEAAISDSVEILDALISLNPTVIFEDCDLCAGSEHCICLVPEFLEEQDVPIMIISGENETDDIGYEGMLGIDIYLNHPDMTTKLLYEILDGGHSSAIPHIEPVRKKVISWLNYYLNDDTQVCSQLLEEPDNISQFLTNFECEEQLGFEENFMPLDFALHQNYPNPFNPMTTLRYDLPEDSFVDVTIYDMLGNEVKRVNNHTATNPVEFNNQGNVSAGVYLYKIQANDFVDEENDSIKITFEDINENIKKNNAFSRQLIGSFFIPINTTFATDRTKHLSKGLNLIHKVLSRPLDIVHYKCLSSKEVWKSRRYHGI